MYLLVLTLLSLISPLFRSCSRAFGARLIVRISSSKSPFFDDFDAEKKLDDLLLADAFWLFSLDAYTYWSDCMLSLFAAAFGYSNYDAIFLKLRF